MTEAEILWNDLKFCTKRRQEQFIHISSLYEKMYYKQISEDRFKELWESAYGTLVKFRERVNELRRKQDSLIITVR